MNTRTPARLLPLALLALSAGVHAQVTRSDSVLEPARSLDTRVEALGAPRLLEDGSYEQDLSFENDISGAGDVSLTGIWSARYLTFGLPAHWKLVEPPVLYLDVMRSAQLIPEISAITVWADSQPVGTFRLDGDPGSSWQEVMPTPLVGEVGQHTIQFNAYHRSWMPCELADHPGLWSRLLSDSFVRVHYNEVQPKLSLSDWPLPFIDQDDPNPAAVVIQLPAEPTQDELLAAGLISAALGREAGERRIDLRIHMGALAEAPAGNIIALTRPGDTDTAALLSGSSDTGVAALGAALGEGAMTQPGALALVPRPGQDRGVVLVVAASDGPHLTALAGRLLGNQLADQLPVGASEWVGELSAVPAMEARRWKDTVPPEVSFTLADLGLDDLTAQGFRGGTVTIPLNLVPDDRPISGKATLDLVYSYSAQASPGNSRLDVLINGAGAGGEALDNGDGETRQHLEMELPVHDLSPASALALRFDLVGREEPICLGETHDELWGTVHADTRITLPRELTARYQDLGLIRYGGYPFGIWPDLAHTLFVLPDKPTANEIQVYAWLTGELGRTSRGDRLAFQLSLGDFDHQAMADADLVVIDGGPGAALLEEMGLLESAWFHRGPDDQVNLRLADGSKVSLEAQADVAYVEEMPLPWSSEHTAMVVYAQDDDLFERIGPCPGQPPLFDRLSGRLTRIAACDDLVSVAPEDIISRGSEPRLDAVVAPPWWRPWVMWGLILVLSVLAAWIIVSLAQRIRAGLATSGR